MDDWLCNISDGKITGVCSLDIKQCFDTINHDILLRKMEFYGLQPSGILWFQSYLQERTQVVSCHNELSDGASISIGIPQGSVLLLLYVNDISQHVHRGACNGMIKIG